jgi:hypothetical protein
VAEREHWEDTLRGLRETIRAGAAPTSPAAVRARGGQRRRVRRASTALVAAAATVAVVIGGATLVRGAALPPTPPAATPTPAPTVSTTPTARPTLAVPAWPDDRIDDAIAETDWVRATVQMPAHPGCPSGEFKFRAGHESVAPADYPRAFLDPDKIAYGDLTGDGRPEAVLSVSCFGAPEDSGDGQGQLLVVTREGDRLRALGWVGPRGGLYPEFWIENRVLYMDVHPWLTPWEHLLAQVQAYTWSGSQFERIFPEGRFPPLVAAGGPGPAIDFGPAAEAMGCPAETVRFSPDGTATVAGVRWDLEQPAVPDDLAHWVDLEGTGTRRLLAAVTCDRPAGVPANWVGAVAVLEWTGDGYRALDAVRRPDGMAIAGWSYARGVLTLSVAPDAGGEVSGVRYTWNGSYFQR